MKSEMILSGIYHATIKKRNIHYSHAIRCRYLVNCTLTLVCSTKLGKNNPRNVIPLFRIFFNIPRYHAQILTILSVTSSAQLNRATHTEHAAHSRASTPSSGAVCYAIP